MYFKVSWNQEFDDLMHHLWSKYGRDLFTLDGIGDQLDLHKFAKNFFKTDSTMADLSVDANANVVAKSVIEWNFEFPKPLQRYNSYYLLWKELREAFGLEVANNIIEDQLTGRLYINDFTDVGRPYCFNYSTYDVALSGLSMSKRMLIVPPKSLQSFIRQIEQFTVYAANSTLGATGLADFLIVASIYAKRILDSSVDGNIRVRYPWKYIEELLTSFVYTINWEFRGNQSPFTNISLYDRNFLEKLCPDYVLDGEAADPSIVSSMQNLFMKIMNTELDRSPLTFPVVTACMATDEENNILDKPFRNLVAERNMKYGFINMYYGKTSTLSSCCRLRSDQDNPYFNSFGAGSTKIGSLGVVTINLPRAAQEANGSIKEFLTILQERVIEAAYINECKRRIIDKRIEGGSMPLYTLGHMALSKQYSTAGFTGLYECVSNLGFDMLSEEGQNLASIILELMNDTNDILQDKFKSPHNMEQVPAESSAVKLAKKDSMLGYNDRWHIYSNQFIPLTAESNMLTRLELQGKFDGLCSGGAICHVNVGETIDDVNKMTALMDYAAKCGVVYWAVNYAIKRCENGHVWVGKEDICPACGEAVHSTTTRVVGFFTNVNNWNPERREYDWPDRQWYSI